MMIQAQSNQITFAAQGDVTTVDEVIATNLITNESVNIPGTAILTLQSVATGVDKTITAEVITCADYEGNNYKTVKIGNQVWMAENLKSTKYSGGTSILLITETAAWWDTDRASTILGYSHWLVATIRFIKAMSGSQEGCL